MMDGTPRTPAADRDGWTVASLAIATGMGVLVGAFVAGLATFTHRQWRIPIGALRPPLGLLVGLVLVVLVVAGLRLAFARVVALGGAVGAMAAIALLAIPGAGGTAVVVGDAIGWTWMLAPAAVCAVVLAWPAPSAAPNRLNR